MHVSPTLLDRRPWTIYLVQAPNFLVAVTLGPYWPTTHNLTSDWANLAGTLLTFMWGYVFASETRLLDVVTRRRREFAIAGLAVAATFFFLYGTGITAGLSPTARLLISETVSGYYGMTWIFALTGYARAVVKSSGPVLCYAKEVVYPLYIVHQTITIALVFWMLHWPLGVWPKLALVSIGTFAGSPLEPADLR